MASEILIPAHTLFVIELVKLCAKSVEQEEDV
jgi:hypothetical protein